MVLPFSTPAFGQALEISPTDVEAACQRRLALQPCPSDTVVEAYGARRAMTLFQTALAQLGVRFPANASVGRLRNDAHTLGGSIGFLGYDDLAQACDALIARIVMSDDHGPALARVRLLVEQARDDLKSRCARCEGLAESKELGRHER